MKRMIGVHFVISLSLILASLVLAQEKESKAEQTEKVKPRKVNVIGRIIDSECYMKMGDMALADDHDGCAEACAEGGIPLAILEDKTNNVYFTTNAGMSMVSTNEKLMPYLGERVSIKGKLIERGGAKLLVITSIEKTK